MPRAVALVQEGREANGKHRQVTSFTALGFLFRIACELMNRAGQVLLEVLVAGILFALLIPNVRPALLEVCRSGLDGILRDGGGK